MWKTNKPNFFFWQYNHIQMLIPARYHKKKCSAWHNGGWVDFYDNFGDHSPKEDLLIGIAFDPA